MIGSGGRLACGPQECRRGGDYDQSTITWGDEGSTESGLHVCELCWILGGS